MRIALVFLVTVALMAQVGVMPSSGSTGKQEQGIQWAAGFDEALDQARAAKKPVLLDFFNPN
jgi:thiol:disulfide interchange protein